MPCDPCCEAPQQETLDPIKSILQDFSRLEHRLRSLPESIRHNPLLLQANTALGSYLVPQRRDGKDLPMGPPIIHNLE